MQQFFEEKDRFVLLTVGTLVLFDPHDPDIEAAEGVKIPRVLWNQSRAQPPRYACGQHSDDVTQHVGDNVSLERSFYFALVNLLAHLCADRNTANSALLSRHIPDSVVKAQLVQQETLMNAGLRFVPPGGELLQSALADPSVEARDLGDISDLAGLCAHTFLLLYGFLGQPPFSDEEHRSTIIKSVYLDGRRADDDDTVYDEAGSNLVLASQSLQSLCHMCSWQLASLADLCENMCIFNNKPMPKPPVAFTDAMSTLISALSKMLSKLIGLGYFERFRMHHSNAGDLTKDFANIYKIDHLVSIFTLMHRLQRTHRSVTTTPFVAGLADVCRVINQCCALSVNENILQFMSGFLEFLPPSVRRKVGASGVPINERAPAKSITGFEIEECESVEKVLADLGKPSLPWEAEHVGVSDATRNLAEFVTVLLDFVSLPDARLAIQGSPLALHDYVADGKDFLEAIDRLELLDMDDAEKFNSLETWVKEADRVD